MPLGSVDLVPAVELPKFPELPAICGTANRYWLPECAAYSTHGNALRIVRIQRIEPVASTAVHRDYFRNLPAGFVWGMIMVKPEQLSPVDDGLRIELLRGRPEAPEPIGPAMVNVHGNLLFSF